MRHDCTASAITNSSSELFTFASTSLDEVYDAANSLWDEFVAGDRWAEAVEGWCVNAPSGPLRWHATLSKDDDGHVLLEEEEDRYFERVGFSEVLMEHFGDGIIRVSRV